MPESWLELSSVSEPEAADAVAEVFGRIGRGVAIDQPVMQSPDQDGGWIDASKNVVVKTYIPVDEESEEKRRLLEEAAWHLGRLRHVEPLQVKVIREGREYDQGVAYLQDGTMIVVEGGRSAVGKEVTVEVTSVLQSPSGKMIFTKLPDGG